MAARRYIYYQNQILVNQSIYLQVTASRLTSKGLIIVTQALPVGRTESNNMFAKTWRKNGNELRGIGKENRSRAKGDKSFEVRKLAGSRYIQERKLNKDEAMGKKTVNGDGTSLFIKNELGRTQWGLFCQQSGTSARSVAGK